MELDEEGNNGRSWSYKELLEDSLKLAGILASRHKKGSRVVLWAGNCPEWVILEFAFGLAGVTLVTANPSIQAKELEYLLTQSKAEALYYMEEFRGNPLGDIARSVCSEIPSIKQLVLITDHDELFAGEGCDLPVVNHDDPAQIQYTSGTTGFPKGAVLRHSSIIQCARDTVLISELNPGDKAFNAMPLFHTGGCVMMTLTPLIAGGCIYLAPLFNPVMAARVIEREKIQMMLAVPTMIQAIIEVAQASGKDLKSFKTILSGGAMVSPELAQMGEEYLGALVQIVYGQTETSPLVTIVRKGDSLVDATETVGKPLPHMEVSIRDTESNAVMPLETKGEICVRGYNLLIEYNDNPEATANTIDSEGWLHTGDLGTMDSRGYIKIVGRVKEMIIRGGENLFPAEIELAMLEHEAIAEVSVVGIPDEKWGEQVACFMRPVSEHKPLPQELKTFVRQRLSPQKTPTFWIWVDSWPMTGSNKIQKYKLTEGFVRGDFEVLSVK